MPRASARTKRPTPAQLAPLISRQATPAPLLPQPLIERLLAVAMEKGGEFAEVYVERSTTTGVILEESRIKSAQTGLVQGVGLRVISGAKVGYAYSDNLDEEALLRAARTAAMIAQGGGSERSFKVSRAPAPSYYRVAMPLAEVDVAHKAELVLRADKAARAFDSRVKQVNGSYADNTKRIAVANTLGHYTEDTQDLCRIGIQVVAEGKNKERRTGMFGGGGRVSFNHWDNFTPEQVGREAARQAVATLGAAECPSGPQTVVLAPGWSGILLHEAVGHGLEADFIRKGTSLFAGKMGEKVASDLVTVIDDGTMANSRGSINVDDEGVPAERKVLIEKGVLKGYMYDSLNAKLMGQKSTGSGRRESFKSMPLPRMTNTYLAPGDHSPEEIIKEVKRGLYCANFGGGQVDITNGNFVFEVSEAYQIEDGKLGRPVKNAILIGVGPEALKNVSRVGNDPMPDPGMGTCGKDGQSVPVGVGLPTLRIDNMTVGGTKV
ncbi:TldD/PmbA family protein [Hyalangium versicolor]|uniref:TldD/PmbA family protein n=1 Tax=Hyalangium versicolor TaxID=2861190 RepID=UPI001CCBAF1B|nr:TldD/PmbA family protein [Hyalangium versicolor]